MTALTDPLAGTSSSAAAANIAARLQAATVAHRDAQEVATKAGKAWRRLIVEAVDGHGMRQDDVAKLVGVSRSRIHAVIHTEYRRP